MNDVLRETNYIGKSAWGADALYQGDIAEIILYNRPLSASEIRQVESYLAAKYALASAGFPESPPLISPNGGDYATSVSVTLSSPAMGAVK